MEEGVDVSLVGDLCQLGGSVSKAVGVAAESLVGDLCQLGGGVSTVFDRRYRAGGDDFLSPRPKTFSVPAREIDEGVIGEGGTATWLVVRGLYPELDDDANDEVNELGICICCTGLPRIPGPDSTVAPVLLGDKGEATIGDGIVRRFMYVGVRKTSSSGWFLGGGVGGRSSSCLELELDPVRFVSGVYALR